METFTNKYAILVIVNLPLLFIAIVGTLTNYKTGRISRKKATTEVLFWLAIGLLLVLVEPLYNTLIRHNLTNSAPMNIFDVGLLTLFVLSLLFIKQSNEKVSQLNKKVARMHESIVLAEEARHWDKDK
jgi:predicted membrane channel-forming protein YqfA (hemolysin III family)